MNCGFSSQKFFNKQTPRSRHGRGVRKDVVPRRVSDKGDFTRGSNLISGEHSPAPGSFVWRSNIERAIQARLVFLDNVQNLKDEVHRTPTNKHVDLLQEIEDLTQLVHETESNIKELNNYLLSLRREVRMIKMMTREEEWRHRETLSYYQTLMIMMTNHSFIKKMRRPGSPRAVFSKSFVHHEEAASTSSSFPRSPPAREVSFAGSLMLLPGLLQELSQGEHGSALLIRRISEGSDSERDLVWSELKLPASLLSFIINKNKFVLEVILALANNKDEFKTKLCEFVKKHLEDILAVEGGDNFVNKLNDD